MRQKRANIWSALPQVLFDIVWVYFSYWIALMLRFDGKVPWWEFEYFQIQIPWATCICLVVFFLCRFYTTMWQFASLDELIQIFFGVSISSVLIAVMGFTMASPVFHTNRLPIPVYLMGWALMFLFVGGSRFSIRLWHRRKRRLSQQDSEEFHRVMVVGAGEMGSMVIKDMKTAPESKGIPVVAIDDDKSKRGTRIHGVKVAGGRESIPRMAGRYNVDQIVLAIASAKKEDRQDILSICAKTGCKLKTVPALYEILEGDMEHPAVRDVDILDLLGRDEVDLNVEEISGYLKNKTVLVTGGGGSIGSELCRQIAHFHPKRLIIFDIYENNAYDLQNELLMKFPNLNLEVLIGSVRDRARVEHVFEVCRPDVVFHAAAH